MEALRVVLNGMAHPDWRGWYRYYSWLPESSSCLLGQKSNINHESQTLKYRRFTIKNHHGGDPKRKLDGGDTTVAPIWEQKKWITMKLLHAKSASKSLFPLHKYPEDIESILRKQIESTAKIYSFWSCLHSLFMVSFSNIQCFVM